MTAVVLAKLLSPDPKIDAVTDHCIDDIIVDTSLVRLHYVMEHLQRYGFANKITGFYRECARNGFTAVQCV